MKIGIILNYCVSNTDVTKCFRCSLLVLRENKGEINYCASGTVCKMLLI